MRQSVVLWVHGLGLSDHIDPLNNLFEESLEAEISFVKKQRLSSDEVAPAPQSVTLIKSVNYCSILKRHSPHNREEAQIPSSSSKYIVAKYFKRN